jgi:hypothetical protein
VQKARRPLLIRGSFNPEEMRLLMDALELRGRLLNIMVNTIQDVESFRPLVGI